MHARCTHAAEDHVRYVTLVLGVAMLNGGKSVVRCVTTAPAYVNCVGQLVSSRRYEAPAWRLRTKRNRGQPVSSGKYEGSRLAAESQCNKVSGAGEVLNAWRLYRLGGVC